jgi:hypothetical protein
VSARSASLLATSGMLLLVYALVRAPDQGWSSARTIGELATAAVVLTALPPPNCAAATRRSRSPSSASRGWQPRTPLR